MKTKFDGVVKLKKQKVDSIQKNLQKINASINELNLKISSLEESLRSFTIPREGKISIINQIKHQQGIIRDEIAKLQNQITVLKSRKNELLEELKKANTEYEKMKYLQNEEIKKALKELKLKESREMDELAILLRKKNGPE